MKYCIKILLTFFLIIWFCQPCLGHVGDIVETDIRGIERPQGYEFDIGAFEYVYEIDPPANLFVTVDDPDGLDVTLDWDPSLMPGIDDGLAGYEIYYDTDSGEPYANSITVDDNTAVTAAIADLIPRQVYYFAMRAFDNQGTYSEYSNEVSTSSEAVSDKKSSGGGVGGGCFIATAAYGSPFEKHVEILRQFRDTCLMKTGLGRGFVKFYYEYSPGVAEVIARHKALRFMMRWGLAPVVGMAWVALHTSMIEKVGITFFIMMFIGLSAIGWRKVKGFTPS